METTQRVIIRTTEQAIADMLVQHFNGLPPVVFQSAKSTKEDLKKKGATFATLKVRRVFGEGEMVKKHRESKIENPFLNEKTAIEEYSIEVLLNCVWQSVLDRRIEKHGGNEGFEAQKERANGIQNYGDSRVVCSKIVNGETRFYINYIVFEYLTDRVLHDETGREIDSVWFDGFLKSPKAQKEAGRQREADKHGLEIEFDPQNRQMKMSNIENVSVFGFDYQPTRITTAKVVNVQPTQTTQQI